jgi:hypothetical protein
MTTPRLPDDFQRRILQEANKVVAQVDGKPFTTLDKLLLQLKTSERPEERKLFLGYIQEAHQADHAWHEQAVKDIIAYKEHWGPIFRRRRALGQSVPEVYPDPDDIVILSATEFEFIGPLNAEQAAQWAGYARFQAACAMIANEIIEAAGLFRPLEQDRQTYLKFRRQFYRFNRRIPIAFKKKHPFKYPPFKPPAEPPAWY